MLFEVVFNRLLGLTGDVVVVHPAVPENDLSRDADNPAKAVDDWSLFTSFDRTGPCD
jgi:hypothetical protein